MNDETTTEATNGQGGNASPHYHNAYIILQAVIILIVTGFFAWFLIKGVTGGNEIINQMDSIKYARGVITFILAVGTMIIALWLDI